MARATVSNLYGTGLALTYGNAASVGFFEENFVETTYQRNDLFIDQYNAGGGYNFFALIDSRGTDLLEDDIILRAEFTMRERFFFR